MYLFPLQSFESVLWYSATLNSGILEQYLLTQIYLASLGNLKLHTDSVMIPHTQDDPVLL